MFELMTHVQGVDFGRWQMAHDGHEDYDSGYQDYVAQNKMTADPETWKELISEIIDLQLSDTFPYKADLLRLVGDMLDPDPMGRPTIDAIFERADDGLQQTLAAHEPQDQPGKKPKKSTKAASKKQEAKPKLPVLYYTQEQWAKIPAGPIKWKEDKDNDPDRLAWLKLWAYQLMMSLDPDGPLIKQPPFMKDEERVWARTSDQQRAMALEDPETGRLIRMGEMRLHKFKNAAEMEANVRKQGAAEKKRKRTAADDDAAKKPAAKRGKVSTALDIWYSKHELTRGQTKTTVEDKDATSGEDEVEPPAKKHKTQQRKSKKDADKAPKAKDKQNAPSASGRKLRSRKPVKY